MLFNFFSLTPILFFPPFQANKKLRFSSVKKRPKIPINYLRITNFAAQKKQSMSALGKHILVELYACSSAILNEVPFIEQSMVEAAKEAGATVINSTFHHFSPFGVSGVVVIQESHLAIHTWPEYQYAAVDLFTCGDQVDPWVAYDYLKKAFQAQHGSAMEMKRGPLNLLGRVNLDLGIDNPVVKQCPPQFKRDVWFTDKDENTALSLRHKGDRLYRKKSPFQLVEVYDTYEYGKMLTIDNMVMCTEKDEYVYHEMIAHVPALTHQNVKRALVIGGGDGGTIRELLKHDSIEEVIMVEIDAAVIEASKEFLPSIACSFDHPKLKVIVGDGIKYMAEATPESFDLILVDSTDPIGPAEGLFSYDFYRNAYAALSPSGILVTQSESPRFNVKAFKECYTCYRSIFGDDKVHCYLFFTPTYPSGMWSFSYSCKGDIHPLKDFDAELSQAFAEKHDLKYYNAGIHQAAFALPTFVQKMLAE